ncbi:hypothetical protein [Dokdonia sp.]|uniref:hypothetical protein n=1 Tax=Dokdonia sp. TaxID=2024995 RepID=UPI0032649F2C
MEAILRPTIDKEVIEDYLEDLDKLINDIEGHIYNPDLKTFGRLGLTAYWGAQAAMAANRSQEDIWRYLCLTRDFFRAHHGNIKHQGKRIYIYI